MEFLDDWAAEKEQLSIIDRRNLHFHIINCLGVRRGFGGQGEQQQNTRIEKEKNKKEW